MKRIFRKISLIVLVLLVVLSAVSCTFFDASDENNIIKNNNFNNSGYTTRTDLPSSISLKGNVEITENNSVERSDSPSSLQEAYKKVKGSAVAILVSGKDSSSAGSGTIVDINVNGETSNKVFYVLTCFHVIGEEGATVKVCIPDNHGYNYGESGYDDINYTFIGKIGGVNDLGKIDKTQAVTLVGGDKESDVAVLRLYVSDSEIAKKVVKAKIINPTYSVSVAEEVFLLSNPTGVQAGWFSWGHISKTFAETNINGIGNMTLYGLDLSAYHGSSGGGIFNLYGEVVGILNSGSDENIGMNYGIPFKITDNEAKDKGFINVMKQLIATTTDTNYGYVSGRRVQFGFTVSGASNTSSPVIESIVSGGMADSEGLRASDIITSVKLNDGETISNIKYSKFIEIMNGLKIGDSLIITVQRTTNSGGWFGGGGTTTKSYSFSFPVYQFLFCNTESVN